MILCLKANNNQLACLSTAVGQLRHLEVHPPPHHHHHPYHHPHLVQRHPPPPSCSGVKLAKQPAGESPLIHCSAYKPASTQVKSPNTKNHTRDNLQVDIIIKILISRLDRNPLDCSCSSGWLPVFLRSFTAI